MENFRKALQEKKVKMIKKRCQNSQLGVWIRGKINNVRKLNCTFNLKIDNVNM